MSQEDQDIRRVAAAIESLSEFFDTVQIFVTRHEGSETGTVAVQKGCGNWFARRGQIQEWVEKNDEQSRIEVRREEEN